MNGELLDNTELLLVAICTAYTGPKPESCSKKVQLNKIEALPSKSIIGQNATNV